jgi:hypothetical protein
MRILPGLSALAALTLAATTLTATGANAQPAPPGSYRERCTDIRMNGQFLSATCRGARGGGQSSINVASCAGDIGVDAAGALSCQGPGAGHNPPLPPGVGAPRPPVLRPPPGQGQGRDAITVYSRKNFQGRSARFDHSIANLGAVGMNDSIRSIRFERRSGPWMVCTDANFRGHCDILDRDIEDVHRIGMDRAISSLRPSREGRGPR